MFFLGGSQETTSIKSGVTSVFSADLSGQRTSAAKASVAQEEGGGGKTSPVTCLASPPLLGLMINLQWLCTVSAGSDNIVPGK